MELLLAALLCLFAALVIAGALSDVATMTIPNWISGVLVVAFFPAALAAGLPVGEVAGHVGVGFVALLLGMVMFALRWIGGGDAKLISATVLWTGLGLLLQYLIYAALLGGALTLVILAIRRYPLPPRLASQAWLDRLHDPKTGVPYGIALAIAAVLVYPQTAIFVRLMSL